MSQEFIYVNFLLNKASHTDEEKLLLVNYLSKKDTPEPRQLLLEKFAMNNQNIGKIKQVRRDYFNLTQKGVAEMAGTSIYGKQYK